MIIVMSTKHWAYLLVLTFFLNQWMVKNQYQNEKKNLFIMDNIQMGDQGRNHGENLGSTSVMVGRICPPLVGIGLPD